MTPTNVGSTRPTDAEIIKMLRGIVNPPSRRDKNAMYRHAIRQGEALMMASALEAASADKTGSLHRSGCSPDCSTHHRMTNDGQLGDGTDGQDRESYSDTQDRKSYTPTEV